VDAGDVGGKQRQADDGPREGVRRHEIITGLGFAALIGLGRGAFAPLVFQFGDEPGRIEQAGDED
jgi:hypothetical protein